MQRVPTCDLLLEIRLCGLPSPALLAGRLGDDPDAVALAVDELVTAGLVREHRGRIEGLALTAEGRTSGEELLAAELVGSGTRAEVEEGYRRFLPCNVELLRICADWQLRAGAVNDHSDSEHDRVVLESLAVLLVEVEPVLARLAAAQPRFARYQPRLVAAHARVTAGQHDWLLRPTQDSVHTVWFELHEHLLASLGRSRSEEHAADDPDR